MVLGVVALTVSIGTTSAALIISAYAIVVVKLIIPVLPVSLELIVHGLQLMFNPMGYVQSSVFAMAYLMAYILMLLLSYRYRRKKQLYPLWLVAARIVMQTLVLLCYTRSIPGINGMYDELIVFSGAIALTYDVRKCLTHQKSRGWWNALAIPMLVLLCNMAFGINAIKITDWFTMKDSWFGFFLLALGVGALMLVNDGKSMYALWNSPGWFPVVWAGVLLFMKVWPRFMSLWGLYLLFPLTAMLVDELIQEINPRRCVGTARAVLKWVVIVAVVLLQIKAERMGRFIAVVLMLLETAGVAVAWHASGASDQLSKESGYQCLLGIAAVLLCFSLRIGDPMAMQQEPWIIMVAVLCCFGWYLVCRSEKSLVQSNRSIYPQEFELLRRVIWVTPVLLLAVSVLCIWTAT